MTMLVDQRITCIDQETLKLFKIIANLAKSLLADENGSFAMYFAKNGTTMMYKLFIKNDPSKDCIFSC